jgi:transposase
MGKRVDSKQFKNAAFAHVVAPSQTISSVANRLNVNYHTLGSWVLAAKSGSASSTVPASLPAEQRIRELQKELARTRMERDISKKATAFFAKEQM